MGGGGTVCGVPGRRVCLGCGQQCGEGACREVTGLRLLLSLLHLPLPLTKCFCLSHLPLPFTPAPALCHRPFRA